MMFKFMKTHKENFGTLCDDLNSPLVLTEMHNLLKIEDFDGFINSMVFRLYS